MIEKEFISHGLICIVYMTKMGHRCGYVGIDKDNELYGVDYGDYTDDRLDFEVHGGITYSRMAWKDSKDKTYYPKKEKNNLYWFGFDCNHAWDSPDLNAIQDSKLKEIYSKSSYYTKGIVRSSEYVEQQCIKLAEQLSKFGGKG